jgi:hydrogenase-1 operon protein HyaF
MTPFPIFGLPVGPGSQPEEPDGIALDYLPMPNGMATYRAPLLPEPEAALARPAGLDLLARILDALNAYRVGDAPWELDLAELAAPDLELVEQTLGEGEVSVRLAGTLGLRARETRLAGVWRVRGARGRDRIEVADIPRMVRAAAFAGAATHLDLSSPPPSGVMTARSVLAEIDALVVGGIQGDGPHIVNLTLLPQSPEDLDYLDERLGTGPVTILSRGYGNCRIDATALTNCWWVRHFNVEERLILNTLEVVDVPAAALAAQEDIEDSAGRLREILDALL